MATNVVNMDALIPREDMAEGPDAPGIKLDTISITHLEDSFFALSLRKPDFQRETVHWSPDKVLDLVRAFIDGDLIPAVILWRRSQSIFVIDGAHRLSALLAWVNDDYGHNRRSLEYFGNQIPDEQKKIAERTRKLINEKIGAYAEYAAARRSPDTMRPDRRQRLANLGVNSIIAQWVTAVDPQAAEDSFFKINQAATPIDATERRILKSRGAPNAVASRAIVRGGAGHNYWKHYAAPVQAEIVVLAKYIYGALYEPPISDGTITTSDLPVAGRGYNALPFVFDLVNWANDVADPTRAADIDNALPSDTTGATTIAFLKKIKASVDILTGDNSTSLGIHPVVYCYTRGGEFQPMGLLATAALVRQLERDNKLREFTTARRAFEDFLLAHKEFITLIIKRTGAGRKSLPRIVRYFQFVIECIALGLPDAAVVTALEQSEEFAFLLGGRAPMIRDGENPQGRFSRRTKSATFLATAMQSAVRCAECGGFVHKNSVQFDHTERRRDGGPTHMGNARVVHPYCNSIRG